MDGICVSFGKIYSFIFKMFQQTKRFNYPESVMHDRKGKIRYAIGIHKFINQQSIRTGAARVQFK